MSITQDLKTPLVAINGNIVGVAKQLLEGTVTVPGNNVLTVTDGDKDLVVDQFKGYYISIVSGGGIGSSRRIVSNTQAGEYTCDVVLSTSIGDKYTIHQLPSMDADGSVNVKSAGDEGNTPETFIVNVTNIAGAAVQFPPFANVKSIEIRAEGLVGCTGLCIGGSGVDATSYSLGEGDSLTIDTDLSNSDTLYGIANVLLGIGNFVCFLIRRV